MTYSEDSTSEPPEIPYLQDILQLYDETGHNAAEITRRLKDQGVRISRERIAAILKSQGLSLPHGGRRNNTGKPRVDENDIIKIYPRVDGNAIAAAQRLGYHPQTVRSVWRRNNLQPKLPNHVSDQFYGR